MSQSLLDERLQLRIGEDAAPRQVAEARSVAYGESVGDGSGVAHQALHIHVGTLVFIVYSAAAKQQTGRGESYNTLDLHIDNVFL